MTCPACGAALDPATGACVWCAATHGAAWSEVAAADDPAVDATSPGFGAGFGVGFGADAAGESVPVGFVAADATPGPSAEFGTAGASAAFDSDADWAQAVPAFPVEDVSAGGSGGYGSGFAASGAGYDAASDPGYDPWQGGAQLEDRGAVGEHRLLRDQHGTVLWRCGVCETINHITEEVCRCCSTSLFSAESAKPMQVEGSAAVAMAAGIVPGGGQFYLGLKMQGLARFCLFVLVVVSAAGFPSKGPLGTIQLALYGVGLLIWVVSISDARVAAVTGDPDKMLIKNRSLTWLTVGVLGLLLSAAMLVVVLGSFQGTPGG